MAEPTTRVIAYALFVVSFLVMLYYILRQARDNRKIAIDDFGPNIAGSDVISGAAKNPKQFEEPDDDALEEMAELLGDNDN
tara:strand:- start:1394 stop:1636 length:243 start_codon:yes stop_codon:yes gene_type:complete